MNIEGRQFNVGCNTNIAHWAKSSRDCNPLSSKLYLEDVTTQSG